MPNRIIAHIGADYYVDGSDDTPERRRAVQGEVVDLSAAEVKRLDGLGALVPEVFESFEDFSSMKEDAYRAARGNTEAAGKLAAALAAKQDAVGVAGLATVTPESSGNVLVDWLREDSPSIDDVLTRVDGDPDEAREMIEAEHTASGGNPRKGLITKLTKIADGGE